MANVSLTPAPGYYTEGLTANWVVGDNVDFFATNVNGIAPAISKYIAYDQLSPPQPFIATTQDGNGNVVYDGGFPKIYNQSVPAGNTFATTSATYRYFINAINFVANQEKVAAGNKKILVIGDKSAAPYWIKDASAGSGFKLAIDKLCQLAGFTPTYKDPSNWSGVINPTFAELDQYACVLLVSSSTAPTSLLTDEGERELVTFRQLGNGIIIITDSGTNISDISQAYPLDGSTAFCATANKLARNFGAFFYGNFNRANVQVGYLRQNYGDHPLYAGIADTEYVYGGSSESAVGLANFTKYTKASPPPPLNMMESGRHIVNITASLKDGTIESQRLVYVVATGQLVSWRFNGEEVTEADLELAWNFSPEIVLDLAGLGTILGSIYHNNTKVGEIYSDDANGSRVTWYSGIPSRLRMRHWDQLRARIEVPLTAEAALRVKRFNTDTADRRVGGLSAEVEHLALWAPDVPANRRLNNLLSRVYNLTTASELKQVAGSAGHLKALKRFGNNEFTLDAGSALIYATTALTTTALASLVPPTPKQIFDTWARFSGNTYYPVGTPAPEGSEAAAWTWDGASNSVTNPLNTSAYVGFVSDELVSDYELDVVLTSSAADDDIVALVLAAAPRADGTGVDHLSIVVNPGGLQPTVANVLAVCYNLGATGYKQVTGVDHVPISPGANEESGLWNGRTMRVVARRNGNSFVVMASGWNSNDLLPESRIEFTLSYDPVLAKFIGPMQYGYGVLSQPGVRYRNIRFVGGLMRDSVVDAQTGNVYRYTNGTWNIVNGLKAKDIFGTRVKLSALDGSGRYTINADGSITKTA